jgi:hypothetical protein
MVYITCNNPKTEGHEKSLNPQKSVFLTQVTLGIEFLKALYLPLNIL